MSDCRNPTLQKMFQLAGAGEQAGSGFSRILRAWAEQHWRVPLTSIVAASQPDATSSTTRRRYAAHDRTALDEIRSWEKRNRSVYRAV